MIYINHIAMIGLLMISSGFYAKQASLFCFDFGMEEIPVPVRPEMLVALGYRGVTFAL